MCTTKKLITLCFYSVLLGLFLNTSVRADIFDDYVAQGIIKSSVTRDSVESRGTFVAILIRALEQRAGKTIAPVAVSSFTDISDSLVNLEIRKAEALGILSPNATFRPNDPITRIESLAFTVRTYEKYKTAITPKSAPSFIDLPLVTTDWQYGFMQKGFYQNLTMGYSLTSVFCNDAAKNYSKPIKCFKPAQSTIRVESVYFVEQLIAQLGSSNPPTISISTPTNNSTTSNSTIAVSGTASDDIKVVNVIWFTNFEYSGVATLTINNWNIDSIPLQDGENTITVIAFDAEGNQSSASVKVTKGSLPVTLLDPNVDGSFNTNTFDIDVANLFTDSDIPVVDGHSFRQGKARIHYPVNTQGIVPSNLPVALFLHGQHDASAPNYEGYDYILKRLASYGLFAISINANEINGLYKFGYYNEDYITRGYLVVAFLNELAKWNSGNPSPLIRQPEAKLFNGRLNLQKVGLSGHSRGGEGVVAANHLYNEQIKEGSNPPFKIVAINAIAPTDKAIDPFIPSVPYFLVLGSRDGDVWNMQGQRTYDKTDPRVKKMSALIYGANHNYFNIIWEDDDAVNTQYGKDAVILSPEKQREIANKFITAFFLWHLKDLDLKKLFTDQNTTSNSVYLTYQDTFPIAGFEYSSFGYEETGKGKRAVLRQTPFPPEGAGGEGRSTTMSCPSCNVNYRFFHNTIGFEISQQNFSYTMNIESKDRDMRNFSYLSFRMAKYVDYKYVDFELDSPQKEAVGIPQDALSINILFKDDKGKSITIPVKDIIPHPYQRFNAYYDEVEEKIKHNPISNNQSLMISARVSLDTVKTAIDANAIEEITISANTGHPDVGVGLDDITLEK